MRLWLPDRPGALGAVASRIGAVKGDVVGIEILETGDGQAVDELVVRIPDATLIDLLVAEVRQVDGVQVEEIRPTGPEDHDPRLAGLAAAAAIVGADDAAELRTAIDRHAPGALTATWVAVVDPATGTVHQAIGPGVPRGDWLAAFVAGARAGAAQGGADLAAGDVIWAAMDRSGLALVAGRDATAWRGRERRHLDALAVIVDHRWVELAAPA